MAVAILVLSLVLQALALAWAWPAVGRLRRPAAQVLILATLGLMTLRRGLSLVTVLSGGPFDLFSELVALSTGAMSVVAVRGLGQLLASRESAEFDLRDSEQRLRLALEANEFGVWDWNATRGQLYCDRRQLDLFEIGEAPAPLSNGDLLARIHPDDRDAVRQALDALMPSLRFEIEYCVLDSEGSVRWLQTVGRPREEAGGFVALTRDVTSRMRDELAFRESEQQYRLLADNADDIISLHDLHGRILYVSPSVQRMTGFGIDELLGGRADTLIHPDDWERMRRELRRTIVRTSSVVEWRRLRKDGTFSWSETVAKALRDASGRPERLLCVTRDISARRQSEDALRRSEQQYRAIVETAQEGIWLLDSAGRTRFANSRMAEMLGCPPEEILETSIYDFVDDRAQAAAVHSELRREGASEQLEVTFHRRDGGEVSALASTSPVFDDAGRFLGAMAMIVDITRRKEHEQALQAALAAQETLLKEIHHRVKNNLAVVVNLLMLQRGRTDDPAAEGILRECQDRVYTMSLIHESLHRNRGEATLALAPFVTRLCDYLFQSHALDRDRVRVESRSDDIRVDLDLATPLGLLLNELLSNAFKHAFPGRRRGVVKVDLRRGDGFAELTVRDDGVGLRGDIEFASASSLGLKLVRNLSRQLDGTLTVSRDGGTTFELRFPLEPSTGDAESQGRFP